jgi:ABC-type multidrug transport system ATPase subunit
MSLLELDRVGKRYRSGDLERVVLRDVSLDVQPGELTVIFGLRGSGRSTLLRIAAGIESPDDGTVRFDGRDLASAAEEVLGDGIGFCQRSPFSRGSRSVLELVMLSLLARGVPGAGARLTASRALEQAGVAHASSASLSGLDTDEAMRVGIARVLALAPRVLIIDDPIQGVDLLQRDALLGLLRSLANEGIAVLVSSGESTALSGADQTLSLSDGELRGPPPSELAPVLPMRRAARRAGA